MVPPSRLMALLGQVGDGDTWTRGRCCMTVTVLVSLSCPSVSEVAAAPGSPPTGNHYRLVQGQSCRQRRGGGAFPHPAQQTDQGSCVQRAASLLLSDLDLVLTSLVLPLPNSLDRNLTWSVPDSPPMVSIWSLVLLTASSRCGTSPLGRSER